MVWAPAPITLPRGCSRCWGAALGHEMCREVVGGDKGWLLHWTNQIQILALASLEVQFLRIVAWLAWLSSALQPGVTLPLLSFSSCSWISLLGSDSAQSHLELVFCSTRVSNSGEVQSKFWLQVGPRLLNYVFGFSWELKEECSEWINSVGNERVKNSNLIAQLKSQ